MKEKRFVNKLAIQINNSDIHKKLNAIGYSPLDWTTNPYNENAAIVLTNDYYNFPKYSKYAFWTSEVNIKVLEKLSDMIVCRDLKDFLEKAEFLKDNKYIIID